MNTLEELKKIIEFRKMNRNKCVSTSHTFTSIEYIGMLLELQKRYTEFRTEYTKGKKEPYMVTIPMFKQKD